MVVLQTVTDPCQSNELGKEKNSNDRLKVWYNQVDKKAIFSLRISDPHYLPLCKQNCKTISQQQINQIKSPLRPITVDTIFLWGSRVYTLFIQPVPYGARQLMWTLLYRLYPEYACSHLLLLFAVVLLILRKWIKTVNNLHYTENKFHLKHRKKYYCNICTTAHGKNMYAAEMKKKKLQFSTVLSFKTI